MATENSQNDQENFEDQTSNENINDQNDSQEEIDSLKQKNADLEVIIGDLNKKLLIRAADIENLRKRHKEEIEKSHKYAISNFAADITIVSEQLFLAEENMPK